MTFPPSLLDSPFRQRGGSLLPFVLALIIVGVLGVAWWLLRVPEPVPRMQEAPQPAPVAEPEPAPEPPAPAPAEPEPEPEAAAPVKPLPTLNESDPVVVEETSEIEGAEPAVELSVKDDVLRKWVRAAIAANEGNLVDEYRPVASPPGEFIVEELDEELDPDIGQRYRLSPENYGRYDAYVTALETIDKAKLATLYRRFYPLLEEAHQQHGVNNGSLHETVLAVIDSLLETPVVEDEIILVQPKVYYHYFDPELEALSEPQKLLIRTGPENTRRVQSALRELREELEAGQ